MKVVILFLVATLATHALASDIVLESFAAPKHKWTQQNDPVMGGKSTGTFTIENDLGVFDGDVVNVPFLKAPGFIKVSSTGLFASYPDITSCTAMKLTVKSDSAYTGYRFSFGNAHPSGGKFFAYGYKANFNASVGEFSDVVLPFNDFTDLWDDATGNPIKTCKEDKQYCPDMKTLRNVKTMSVWAEGVAGKVHLEIKQISATGCTASETAEPQAVLGAQSSNFNNTCSGPVQSNLRYNQSKSEAIEDFPFPVADGETLAEAVCCDAQFKPYAEPRFLFNRSDVALYQHMNAAGTTTFYDSVCGIPLFIAPRGRSFEDFQADTNEHGWPSFRPAELVPGNSHIDNSTGFVTSKCGTHLGSFLPDARGARWCLDLVCISGSPAARAVPRRQKFFIATV